MTGGEITGPDPEVIIPTAVIPPQRLTCGLCGWHGPATAAPDHQPAPHDHAADGPWGCCGLCRRLHDELPENAARITALMERARRACDPLANPADFPDVVIWQEDWP